MSPREMGGHKHSTHSDEENCIKIFKIRILDIKTIFVAYCH